MWKEKNKDEYKLFEDKKSCIWSIVLWMTYIEDKCI